jgi:hypothetical protein
MGKDDVTCYDEEFGWDDVWRDGYEACIKDVMVSMLNKAHDMGFTVDPCPSGGGDA